MYPLGALIQYLRRNNGEILFEMAKAVNLGSATLSGIEHGRLDAPSVIVDDIANHLQLDPNGRAALHWLATLPRPDWQAIGAMHAKLSEAGVKVDSEEIQQLRAELNEECNRHAAQDIDVMQALGWCPVYSHPGGLVGIAEDVKRERDDAQARIQVLEEFCKAAIRYAGNAGDDYLADKAREALG